MSFWYSFFLQNFFLNVHVYLHFLVTTKLSTNKIFLEEDQR